MKTFDNYLTEKEVGVPVSIVVYSGRFQPFHKNHYDSYMLLKQTFPGSRVVIATSDKETDAESPLSFKEKEQVITTMFPNIKKSDIVKVKNPYQPKEILSQYPGAIFISAVGEKDAERLKGGKYFSEYNKTTSTLPFEQKGYYYIVPLQVMKYKGKLVTGTLIREGFDKKLFEYLYDASADKGGKIFALLQKKFRQVKVK